MDFSSSSSFSNFLVLLGIMLCKRKPLEDRETEVIENLKKKPKVSVAHIAKAVGRNKTPVYEALTVKHVRKSPKKDKNMGAPKQLTKNETMTKPRQTVTKP